ncbi:MAG: MBL fold metallo-hydrolase [Acidobacteria bacterium]|nr:MBL fold metallo-hydrolase [Acidobacteriota bacterium]
MPRLTARQLTASLVVLGLVLLSSVSTAQSRTGALASEPACQSLTPAAAGGPMPKDPNVIVLRWTGGANYELAYRDNVILLDAYYDRMPGAPALGVSPQDLKRVTAILVGHAHYDHISSAASVAQRTGATVVGASTVGEVVRKGGLAEKQITTVKGGETLEYHGLTVKPVLGHHNVIPAELMKKARELHDLIVQLKPLTEAEKSAASEITARGSRDPRIIKEGTISYLLTFGNRFSLLYIDSPGPVSQAQKQMMQQMGSIDVVVIPYDVSVEAGLPIAMEYVRVFKPGLVLPGSHDGPPGVGAPMSMFPFFMNIREEFPKTKMISTIYRTPICIDATTKDVYVAPY